jgi:hypothetical protein
MGWKSRAVAEHRARRIVNDLVGVRSQAPKAMLAFASPQHNQARLVLKRKLANRLGNGSTGNRYFALNAGGTL